MKKLALLLLAIIAFSCGGNTVEEPKHLLNENEMANVIYDINMLQAMRSSQPQILSYNNIKARNYIFKKYKIDSLTFAQNNAWYAANMDNYEKIQKKVAEKVKKEKDALTPKKDTTTVKKSKNSPKRAAIAKRDSLTKVALDKAKLQKTKK